MSVTPLPTPEERIGERLREVVGVLNRTHAELVDLAAQALESEAWAGHGIVSANHWLVLRAGLSRGRARQLLTVARRVDELPVTMGLLRQGQISLDQALPVATYVPTEYEESVADLALYATVPQIVRATSRTEFPDASQDPSPDDPTPDGPVSGGAEAVGSEDAASTGTDEGQPGWDVPPHDPGPHDPGPRGSHPTAASGDDSSGDDSCRGDACGNHSFQADSDADSRAAEPPRNGPTASASADVERADAECADDGLAAPFAAAPFAAAHPTAEECVSEEPVTEESVAEEPVTEEPGTVAPVVTPVGWYGPDPASDPPRLSMHHDRGRFYLRFDAPSHVGILVENAIREARDYLWRAAGGGDDDPRDDGASSHGRTAKESDHDADRGGDLGGEGGADHDADHDADRDADRGAHHGGGVDHLHDAGHLRDVDFPPDLFHSSERPPVTLADGLAALARGHLGGLTPRSRRDAYRVYVHLDTHGGWLTGRPRLPAHVVDQLTCDGVLHAVWETEGSPVNVGRAQRTVPSHARRLIHDRDRGCRYPGCPAADAPGRHVDVHHIKHWRDQGPSDTSNLVSLCPAHHEAQHRGLFTLRGDPNLPEQDPGGLRFYSHGGWQIRAEPPPPRRAPRTPANSAHLGVPVHEDPEGHGSTPGDTSRGATSRGATSPGGTPPGARSSGEGSSGATSSDLASEAAELSERCERGEPYVGPTGERLIARWVTFSPSTPGSASPSTPGSASPSAPDPA